MYSAKLSAASFFISFFHLIDTGYIYIMWDILKPQMEKRTKYNTHYHPRSYFLIDNVFFVIDNKTIDLKTWFARKLRRMMIGQYKSENIANNLLAHLRNAKKYGDVFGRRTYLIWLSVLVSFVVISVECIFHIFASYLTSNLHSIRHVSFSHT